MKSYILSFVFMMFSTGVFANVTTAPLHCSGPFQGNEDETIELNLKFENGVFFYNLTYMTGNAAGLTHKLQITEGRKLFTTGTHHSGLIATTTAGLWNMELSLRPTGIRAGVLVLNFYERPSIGSPWNGARANISRHPVRPPVWTKKQSQYDVVCDPVN